MIKLFTQYFGRAMRNPEPQYTPTADQALIKLMVELGAVQETYKEELSVMGVQYPLNQAIFCLSNARVAMKRKRDNMFFKITKNGVEFKRDLPDMRSANAELQTVMNQLPEDMPRAFDGQKLVVGNANNGQEETTYEIKTA